MVILDDIHLKNIGLYVSEDRPPVPTPQQDIEYKQIKGRHGSLTKKHGFNDLPYPLVFQIFNELSFKPAFRKAKQILIHTKKLAFEDDPTVYYKIKSVNIEAAENEVEQYGEFKVNFILDPFAYEVTQFQTITSPDSMNNPGYESEPHLKVTAAGTGKIYIGEQVVTIKDVNGIIEMDSAVQNAYRIENGNITNLNNHMIGDFLLLKHGENIIRYDGNITKLEINPRWRWV